MIEYKITDEKIEVGDIVAYGITWREKRVRKHGYVLGVWEEYWDEDSQKFRNKVECVDKDNHIIRSEEWLKKVVLI